MPGLYWSVGWQAARKGELILYVRYACGYVGEDLLGWLWRAEWRFHMSG